MTGNEPTTGRALIEATNYNKSCPEETIPHPWTSRAWPPLPGGARGKEEFLPSSEKQILRWRSG